MLYSAFKFRTVQCISVQGIAGQCSTVDYSALLIIALKGIIGIDGLIKMVLDINFSEVQHIVL